MLIYALERLLANVYDCFKIWVEEVQKIREILKN